MIKVIDEVEWYLGLLIIIGYILCINYGVKGGMVWMLD